MTLAPIMTFPGGPDQLEREFDPRGPEIKAEKGTAPLGPFVRAIREANDESPNRIEENVVEISKGFRDFGHYLKNDLLIDFIPLIPIEVEGKQQLYFNSKALVRDVKVFGLALGVSLVSWFCARPPSGGGGDVPVPTPDGNNNSSDCGAVIAAMNGLATQIGAESFSVIGVDVTHIGSVEEITPDIRQACFIPGAANIEIAAQLDNYTIVSFVAPNGDDEGGLRPVIGVVDRGAAGVDGVAPMMLVDATDAGLKVGRNSAGELTVGLDQACLDGNGVQGCSQVVMELVAQDDNLNAFAVNVLGQVALGPVLLSADQVGQLAGGGDILGMAYAQQDKEAALNSFDQQAGTAADLKAIAGSSGNVGGEAGEPFAPGIEVMQKINEQGFWVVTDNGQLNMDMDHMQVVNATESIFWNQDPREILELQKGADGKATVLVENGINFVVFSKGDIRQKQIIAGPAIFGENLELSTLIVKDVNQIPEGLRQGLDLQLGTTVLAVVDKNTGEVIQLIPSIFDFVDEVTISSAADGQLKLTVNSDAGEEEFQMQTGPISELQKTLGEKYKLIQDGDHFVIQGIDNLKIFEGGRTEFTVGSDVFTVSNRAVSAKDGVFTAGGWENKDGAWSIFGSGAPSADSTPEQLAEWEAGLANFVMDEGASPEVQQAMSDTIHRYVALATEKTAASEFENIYEYKGNRIEVEAPSKWPWASYQDPSGGMEKIFFEDDSEMTYNQLIALDSGYFNLMVLDASGMPELELMGIPIITRDKGGTIFSSIAVTDKRYSSKMSEILNKEERTGYQKYLFITANGTEQERWFASAALLQFAAEQNQELIAEDVIKRRMDKLPQKELETMGFWIIGG